MAAKIWAHRGASGNAPENTLASFRMARDLGAYGVELDVHFTKDHQVVVIHDDVVDRVTNHTGVVKELTLAQLKKLDASNHMAAFAGEKIPTFEEVLALLADSGMHINVEIKTNDENPEGLEEATQALVEQYHMEDRILYSSFNHYSLQQMKKVAPAMPLGILYDIKLFEPWQYARSIGCVAVHPDFHSVNTPGYMAQCHAAGIQCNTWTVNSEEDIRTMLQRGVDGIITNYPARALRLAREFEHQ